MALKTAMVLAFIVLLGWGLWTPDLDRADLERQYTRPSSQFVPTPGLRTHVQIEGPAQAPVVLLLHGFGSSLQTWDVWAEGLATDHRVVRKASEPIEPMGGLVALFGSLAPGGALLKRSAADKTLFEKEARAVVFTSLQDLSERVDDPDLDIQADDIMVLQNAGPTSESGMPEAGYLPIPKKLAIAGVKDMVRISDARMSGTAFGTIVLHVTPEASAGGPLALVRTGDRIRLSVKERRVDLLVDEAELERRRANQPARAASPERGYAKLYQDHVMQADAGCDFDFLRAHP